MKPPHSNQFTYSPSISTLGLLVDVASILHRSVSSSVQLQPISSSSSEGGRPFSGSLEIPGQSKISNLLREERLCRPTGRSARSRQFSNRSSCRDVRSWSALSCSPVNLVTSFAESQNSRSSKCSRVFVFLGVPGRLPQLRRGRAAPAGGATGLGSDTAATPAAGLPGAQPHRGLLLPSRGVQARHSGAGAQRLARALDPLAVAPRHSRDAKPPCP
jgi:hypothetical protein